VIIQSASPTPTPTPALWQRAISVLGKELPNVPSGHASNTTYTVIALLIVLVSTLIIIWKKKQQFDLKPFQPKKDISSEKPETLGRYFLLVLTNHTSAYLITVALPLFLSLFFEKAIFALFALWGFLITTLGAFYAHRADFSSNKALEASNRAYDEAVRTRNAVVHFADSLEMFSSKVRSELKYHETKGDKLSIKFLTVNPAFGHVGMGPTYQRLEEDELFHDFLFNIVNSNNDWNIEMLTHTGEQAREWLTNILSATDQNQANVQAKVDRLYSEQASFIEALADRMAPIKRKIKFWNPLKLPNIAELHHDEEDAKRVRIPFQFFMIKPYRDFSIGQRPESGAVVREEPKALKVFFLFSGDFLYDFVFKILPPEDRESVNMKKLSALTKGYYTDDEELVEIFDNIFTSFSKNMPELMEKHAHTFYPPIAGTVTKVQTS
jgi:hypothetical protein